MTIASGHPVVALGFGGPISTACPPLAPYGLRADAIAGIARVGGSARVLLRTPAEDGEAHAAARAAEPRSIIATIIGMLVQGALWLQASCVHLPAVAHGLRHRVRLAYLLPGAIIMGLLWGSIAGRLFWTKHGPRVLAHRGHRGVLTLTTFCFDSEHRNRHHHLDPSVHRAPVLAVAGEHAHHHLGT